jgi:hypothetical protein
MTHSTVRAEREEEEEEEEGEEGTEGFEFFTSAFSSFFKGAFEAIEVDLAVPGSVVAEDAASLTFS